MVLQEFPRGNKLSRLNLAVLTKTGAALRLLNTELSSKFTDMRKTLFLTQPLYFIYRNLGGN